MEHKLEVDVHAHWNTNPPVYRLFVDNEMFTERTFGWTSYQYFIKEHMCCNLETGIHTLILENLDSESNFELDCLKVNNQFVVKSLMKTNGSKIEWQFIVDLMNANSHANYVGIKLNDISHPMPLASKTVPNNESQHQAKKYQTNLALVQRMRELNNRATKK